MPLSEPPCRTVHPRFERTAMAIQAHLRDPQPPDQDGTLLAMNDSDWLMASVTVRRTGRELDRQHLDRLSFGMVQKVKGEQA